DATLDDRPRDQIDHVRTWRRHHPERNERESEKVGERWHRRGSQTEHIAERRAIAKEAASAPASEMGSGSAIVDARITAPPISYGISTPLRFRLQSWRRCLDFCPYWSFVAPRRAKRDDRGGVEKAKF